MIGNSCAFGDSNTSSFAVLLLLLIPHCLIISVSCCSAGAISGDAAQGAKMGAAVGATAGGIRGLGARRRRRMMY